MNITIKLAIALTVSFFLQNALAQEQSEPSAPQAVLTQKGYDKTAPAVVKLIADEGKKIGAGVVLGIHKDGAGFVLTSYSMVAGREKVAVILRDYPDPLLGLIVDRWIDFDSDLAIVAVKNFPFTQPAIVFGESKSAHPGKTFTILGHATDYDWISIPVELTDSNENHFAFDTGHQTGIDGAPLIDNKGNMIGLIVSDDFESTEQGNITLAVKSRVIQPIISEWFKPINLQKKWREKSGGIATWIWAVGGSLLGGTVTTAILVAGGGEEAPRGLPRPPEPPSGQ
ncbi:MAG: serine protease [bacterium]